MSDMTENPVDVDLFSNLQQDNEIQSKVNPVSQRASFLEKCLHPPTATPNYKGLPTNDARTQAVAQYRNVAVMKAANYFDNITANAVVTGGGQITDRAYLLTNGMRVNAISYFKGTGVTRGQDVWMQDLNNTQINANYNFANAASDMQLYRTNYKSMTAYANMTAFNDVGLVTINQFNPSILFYGGLDEFAAKEPVKFMNFVRSQIKTGHIRVSTPKCKNYEVATMKYMSFPRYIREELQRFCGLKDVDSIDIDPNAEIQILNLGQTGADPAAQDDFPVPVASQVLQQSTRSYGGKAKDGAFVVQRLNTIAPNWQTVSNQVNFAAPIPGLFFCFFNYQDSTGVDHFIPINDNAQPGTIAANLPILQDTLWTSDMTFAWVQFNGIMPNGVVGSSGAYTNNTIITKFYSGFEIQPSVASAFTAFVETAPKPDLMALQALMDGFYELKDGMPAKYNFLGTIGQLAASGLKTFGSSLLKNLFSENVNGSKSMISQPEKRNKKVIQSKQREAMEFSQMMRDKNAKMKRRVAATHNKNESKQIAALNRKVDKIMLAERVPDKDNKRKFYKRQQYLPKRAVAETPIRSSADNPFRK